MMGRNECARYGLLGEDPRLPDAIKTKGHADRWLSQVGDCRVVYVVEYRRQVLKVGR
jgi:hypothetical protein